MSNSITPTPVRDYMEATRAVAKSGRYTEDPHIVEALTTLTAEGLYPATLNELIVANYPKVDNQGHGIDYSSASKKLRSIYPKLNPAPGFSIMMHSPPEHLVIIVPICLGAHCNSISLHLYRQLFVTLTTKGILVVENKNEDVTDYIVNKAEDTVVVLNLSEASLFIKRKFALSHCCLEGVTNPMVKSQAAHHEENPIVSTRAPIVSSVSTNLPATSKAQVKLQEVEAQVEAEVEAQVEVMFGDLDDLDDTGDFDATFDTTPDNDDIQEFNPYA